MYKRPNDRFKLQRAHINFAKHFFSQPQQHNAKSLCQQSKLVINSVSNKSTASYTFSLPRDTLYAFESELSVPLLIDSGASVSIIPKKFVDTFEKDFVIHIDGICGVTSSLGSITKVLNLHFPVNPPHKLYVVDIDLDYAILGMDFLSPRRLSIITYKPMLVQQYNGKNTAIPLLAGQHGLPSDAWCEFLDHWVNNPRLYYKEVPVDNIKTSEEHVACINLSTTLTEAESKSLQVLDTEFADLTQQSSYNIKPTHVLDLRPLPGTDTIKPFSGYRKKLNEKEKSIVREQFNELVQRGVLVHESFTSYSSPVTLVPKRSGKTRICVDYTRLNSRTENLQYPLPMIQSLPELLSSKHCIFSAIDLADAYFSLGLTKESQKLCSIRVDGVGSFRPLRAQFGLKQAPAKFQELANEVIKGLESFVYVYLDDFLVFSSSLTEHLDHLRALFSRLRKFNLFVNRKKCALGKTSVSYLGFKISDKGVTPLQDKVEALKKLKSPRCATELRSFNGSVNFYRRFVPKLAELMSPLTSKLKGLPIKGNPKLTLTEEEEMSRLKVIEVLAKATSLQFEDPLLPLVITTDATKTHCGAILEQYETASEDSPLRPLAFFSSKLPKKVKERSVFNAELTGLYFAVRYFHVRIRHRNLIVRTDHSALINAIENETGCHSPREEGMIAYIKEYAPKMRFVKGAENTVADMLSRPPGASDETSDELDYDDREVHGGKQSFPENALESDAHKKVYVLAHEPPGSLISKVDPKIFYEKQQEEWNLILTIQNDKDLKLKVCSQNIGNYEIYGLIPSEDDDMSDFRIIVPESLRATLWNTLHGNIHQGGDATFEVFENKFFWPNMSKDLKYWARCCPKCQSNKTSRYQKQSLQNFPGDTGRLQVVHLDLVGPLIESDGNVYIFTMKDRATGFLWAVGLPNKTANTVAKAFENTFIGLCGVPSIVVSDQGREFCNAVVDEMLKRNAIKHNTTTAYHPQSNGLVERAHRDLKRAIYALDDRSTWSVHLPYFILQMNNLRNDRNLYSPHQRLFGLPSQLPGYLLFPPKFPPETVEDVNTAVFMELMSHHQKYSRPLVNSKVYISKDLFNCDFVYVRNEEKSASSPWVGPFRVLKREKKFFLLDLIKRQKNVSIDRLKVSYPLKLERSEEEVEDEWAKPNNCETEYEFTRSDSESSSGPERHDTRYNLRPKTDLKTPSFLADFDLVGHVARTVNKLENPHNFNLIG